MATKEATEQSTNYAETLAQMEQETEARAPGVLAILEVYARATVRTTGAWQALNAGPLTYATGASRHSVQQ